MNFPEKGNCFSKIFLVLPILVSMALLQACGGGGSGEPPANTAPTASNVSITDANGGIKAIGDSLTANYTYADVDGDAEGATLFRWLRNGGAISGATASSYVLVAADSNQSISLEVTPIALTGVTDGSPVISSSFIANNNAPVAGNVTITDGNGGRTFVGESLTASYTYSDVENDVEGESSIRWLRNDVVISGALAMSYTLVEADRGAAIKFEVTPVAVTGTLTGNASTSDVINVVLETVAPTTVISFPPAKSMTDSITSASIIVRGSATDASGIASVVVNGVDAISDDGFATWTATVSGLSEGLTTLTAVTTDNQLNTSSQSVEIRRAPLADEISHLALDTTNNRFFVIEKDQLTTVSQTTGLTSRVDATDNLNNFNTVADMQLDSTNNRMIVIDNQDDLSTIKEVNLTTGARTIFSQDLIDQPEGTLSRLMYDLALDAANNILYIADGINGIIKRDMVTGNRTLLSPLLGRGVVFDGANDRLIVATFSSVVAVDVNTGAQTVLANNSIASATSNVGLNGLYGIAQDSANNRVFVSVLNSDQIIKIDLADGTRTLVSDNTFAGDVSFNLPLYLEYDAVNERVIVTDSSLISVNVNTGVRTALSSPSGELDGIGFDAANNEVYAVRRAQSLLKFDLTNTTSSIVSDNTIAVAGSDSEFGDIWGLEMNFGAGLAYITDWSSNSIIQVNLATGARTTIADNSVADANNTFISPTAFAWDEAGNRLLVVDSGRGSVIEVDYSNGTRRVVSSSQVPDRVNAFRTPNDIALDLSNNRAFVLDSGLGAVVAVDLTSGARTIVGSTGGIFSSQYFNFDLDTANNRLLMVNRYDGLVEMSLAGVTSTIIDRDFRDIVFDPASSHAFVLESDTFAGRVLEIVDVNLSTSETVHVPTGVTPDNITSLDNPFDIEIDPTSNRAFVSDTDLAAIIMLDLDTGARTVLADNTISAGLSDITFITPKGIVLDTAGNRLLVTDTGQVAVIAVALDTGARTLISNNVTPAAGSTFDFSSPRYIALDAPNNRALVLDGATVVAVNLSTGVRTILSDNSTGGIQLSSQSDITVDIAGNRALVADLNLDMVVAVDLDTGDRTVFVDRTNTPIIGNDGFQSPLGIALDVQNSRIILVDWWLNTVNAANLSDGARTLLAPAGGANSFFTFQTSAVAYDPEHNRALVVEQDRDAIIAVDLLTGARVIFSQ